MRPSLIRRSVLFAAVLAASATFIAGCKGANPPSGTDSPASSGIGGGASSGPTNFRRIAATNMVDYQGGVTSRVLHTATVGNARVLVVGGVIPVPGGNGALDYDSVGFYEEGTNTYTSALAAAIAGGNLQIATPPPSLMTSPAKWNGFGTVTDWLICNRYGHTASKLPSGQVVIVGGGGWDRTDSSFAPISEILGSIHVYDPGTNSFRLLGARLNVPRWLHSAAALPNGQVLVSGGVDAAGNPVTVHELIDISSSTGSAIAAATGQRGHRFAVSLPAGTGATGTDVIQWGGLTGTLQSPAIPQSANGIEAGMRVVNSAVSNFFALDGTQKPFEAWQILHHMVPYQGKFLIGGGVTTGAQGLGPAPALYIIDLQQNVSVTAATQEPHAQGSVALLNNRDPVVLGGHDASGKFTAPSVYAAFAELYDGTAFTERAGLTQPRGSAVAVTLRNGRVAVIGGCRDAADLLGFSGAPTSRIEVFGK
jgi:hypothetical protein